MVGLNSNENLQRTETMIFDNAIEKLDFKKGSLTVSLSSFIKRGTFL